MLLSKYHAKVKCISDSLIGELILKPELISNGIDNS